MKNLSVMIKPASSLCNLRCKYCFYADVAEHRDTECHGVMTDATVEAMLKSIESECKPLDRVQFIFQGGEPTLAGLDFFRSFVSRVTRWKGISFSYAIQTNGLLLDDAWCAFLSQYGFLVGVSLDLLPDAHDATRVDGAGRGTYLRTVEKLALLRRHRVDFNVLCTLTDEVARHPDAVWEQVVRLGLDYVQFTPCLAPMDGHSSYALTPARFASFYTRLFALWYAEFRRGGRRSVKLFDDVVNLLLLGRPTACGMDGACRGQLVVEADGSAYPCDFYCLDEYCLGSIARMPPSRLLQSDAMKKFLSRAHKTGRLCDSCPYRRFCGGGCERMQRAVYCTGDDAACGYRSFLDACGGTLLTLAGEVRRAYQNQNQTDSSDPTGGKK